MHVPLSALVASAARLGCAVAPGDVPDGAPAPLSEEVPQLFAQATYALGRHLEARFAMSRDAEAEKAPLPGTVDRAFGEVDREPQPLG